MGDHIKTLQSLKKLKQDYEEMGHDAFVAMMEKYDVFMGPGSSINFVNKKIKESYVLHRKSKVRNDRRKNGSR